MNYFKNKLYQSLNVPISRVNQENNFQLGRASDISRDEIKFSKFIKRLRRQFSELFNEILRVQLVLKGVCTAAEFEEMRQYIQYDYLKDMHFDKLKNVEILTDQLNVLSTASEYVGKYFSIEYVRKVILGQTEEDIARIDREIMDEIAQQQLKSQEDIEQGFFESKIVENKTPEVQINNQTQQQEDPEYEDLMKQLRERTNEI